MTIDPQLPCPVCAASMEPVRPWVSRCSQCGFWRSSLAGGAGNEIAGIETLRRDNFRVLLDRLEPLSVPARTSLLEVGCGRGWFMDAAAKRGFRCVAIEPATDLAAETAARGHVVHNGFFPDALPAGTTYSVIVFNDVFEHLPDPVRMVATCHARLKEDGLLVINLPSSDGLLFRIALVLARIGFTKPFERLWQKGLSSPHLSYFSPSTLKVLVESRGFQQVEHFPLATMRVAGMWSRLRSTQGIASSALMYPVLACLALLSAHLPQDIYVGVFRKIGG